MKLKKSLLLFTCILILQACTSVKKETYWVSSHKSECSSGVGETKCLLIYKGENLENAQWVNFYSSIKDFNFEAGYLKKIKVKETHIHKKHVPADAASIQYTLLKELGKFSDNISTISNNWQLTRINNIAINKSIVAPTMQIDLKKMQVSGDSGCNNYSGAIEKLTNTTIIFSAIASNTKTCFNKNIEKEFYNTINLTTAYQIENNNLLLFNKEGNKIATFMKKEEKQANVQLHDIWNVTHINGSPIDIEKYRPQLELNLTEMKIFGTDGCNRFSGNLKEVSDLTLVFSPLITTKKMCRDMNIANNFNKAMALVTSYKLDGLHLHFIDDTGKVVLSFLKGD